MNNSGNRKRVSRGSLFAAGFGGGKDDASVRGVRNENASWDGDVAVQVYGGGNDAPQVEQVIPIRVQANDHEAAQADPRGED